jgi:hypothetical protein
MSAASLAAPVALPLRTVSVESKGNRKIARGTVCGDVSYALKYKNRREPTPNVSVYAGFHANSETAIVQGCKSVVITFANDKVVNLQLVNQPDGASIAADLKFGSSATSLASR